MRNGKWITVGVLGLLLTGCGAGITQEQYDEVVTANASMSEALASAQAEASSARAELYIVNSKIDNASADEGSQSDLIASLKEENESLSMAVMSLQQAAHTTPEASPEETVTASESVTEEEVAEESVATTAVDDGVHIVLNALMRFEEFNIKFTDIKVVQDDDEDYYLKFTYDWENTGDDKDAPFTSFTIDGYQDSVETEFNTAWTDEIDYGIGQTWTMPGGKIAGAHDAIFIEDIDKPMTVIFSEDTYGGAERTLEIANLRDLM